MIGKEYLPSHFLETSRTLNQSSRTVSPSRSGSGYLASGQQPGNQSPVREPSENISFLRRDPDSDPKDHIPDSELTMSEKDLVLRALEMHGGNVAAAARDLSLSRQSLQYRIKKWEINIDKIKLRQRMKNFRG